MKTFKQKQITTLKLLIKNEETIQRELKMEKRALKIAAKHLPYESKLSCRKSMNEIYYKILSRKQLLSDLYTTMNFLKDRINYETYHKGFIKEILIDQKSYCLYIDSYSEILAFGSIQKESETHFYISTSKNNEKLLKEKCLSFTSYKEAQLKFRELNNSTEYKFLRQSYINKREDFKDFEAEKAQARFNLRMKHKKEIIELEKKHAKDLVQAAALNFPGEKYNLLSSTKLLARKELFSFIGDQNA